MAPAKNATQQVAHLQHLIHGVAKKFVERVYGAEGPAWGTSFADLEEMVTQIGRAVSQQMLEQALTRQATASAETPPCPSCGGAVEREEPKPREVRTRVGHAHWSEPQGYCHRCRRSFFPSVGKPGD